jgi:hypothetical protein
VESSLSLPHNHFSLRWRLDISRCRLVQQILQSAPVVQPVLNLRHKVFRHVDDDTPSVRATVQDITLMLLARQTSRAILANAPAPSQAQRTKSRRPKIRRFTLQPVRDIRGRFRINMLHVRHVRLHTRSSQAKSHGKNRKKHASFSAIMRFATEISLV